MELANHLREYRFAHDELTQQELANAVGVTRVTIHSVEAGKFVPSTLLALKLARFFGVGVDDLFYLADGDAKSAASDSAKEASHAEHP